MNPDDVREWFVARVIIPSLYSQAMYVCDRLLEEGKDKEAAKWFLKAHKLRRMK